MKKSLTMVICAIFVYNCANSNPIEVNSITSGIGEEIRSNLYVRQGSGAPVLLDGDLTQYHDSYSNDLDGMDARKMNNFSENLGMIRGTTILVIERRQTISATDTIFYKMWKMQQRPYQLEFITSNLNHPGLEGYLEDSYLNTSTPLDLNGRTTADFDVNSDPASAAVYRFRIIFKAVTAAPLPLTFTSINAYRKNKEIRVDWKTENETNVKSYSVEKSTDGRVFGKNSTDIIANNFSVNNYSWIDEFPVNGYNYYRILNKTIGGETKYSEVLKVINEKGTDEINIYPNPVTDNTMHFKIANQQAGLYEIRLLNNFGQLVFAKRFQHGGGNITQSVRPNQNIQKGIYQVEVVTPGGTKFTEKAVF